MTEEERTSCPECGSESLVENWDGELMCDDCGLLLEDFSDTISTPSVSANLLHGVREDIHETMVKAVKEYDESRLYSTSIRIVSKIQNGPYTYALTSYDSDSDIIEKIEENSSVNVAHSEEELDDIEEPRDFTVGISQEVKNIPATNRQMALVKAGSEYQRDGMEVAGIRIVGRKQQDDELYYTVSFESHPKVESQFNQSD